jgi:hypothetical protein
VVAAARVRADVEGMPQPERQRAAPRRPAPAASGSAPKALRVVPIPSGSPVLDGPTRLRLGHQLRAMYDPVIDEALDPRLAELLQQLDADRAGGAST